MTDNLVTLATFPTAPEAGFVKNILEGEGIRAYLDDDATFTMMSYIGNTLGGVKLDVSAADFERAQQLLAERHDSSDDLDDREFAEQALAAVDPETVDDQTPSESSFVTESDDDEPINPNSEVVARALRAAILGLFCFPVAFYAAWLIARLVPTKDELPAPAVHRYWLAFGITLNAICVYLLMFGASFYYSRFHWWQF